MNCSKRFSSNWAGGSFCLHASKIEGDVPRGDTNAPDIKKRIHQDGLVERSIGRDSVDRWPRTSRESSRLADWMSNLASTNDDRQGLPWHTEDARRSGIPVDRAVLAGGVCRLRIRRPRQIQGS